ncbi:hypothetical protein [Flavobacterium acetivorans]|uniref:hypothetical protein n=1 Tax=Flavobacterium acetivorans TaxID=2893883 RepID=UPI001E474AAC|nr:hypothetical protein [Flavobacterium sp. F-29]UFH36234.1 hypothetical protein LNP19_04120 [Flavobacterium sp. F-29]
MNHKIKTSVFQFLSFLPNPLGVKLYHKLQYFSENKNLNLKLKSSENTFNSFLTICKLLKIEPDNKSIIEIGSGWLPIIPYLFIFKGKAKRVYTYDLNEHYQENSIVDFNAVFSKEYNQIIDIPKKGKYSLPKELVYFPSQNIITAEIPKAEIVFSRFVLEHVTPEDIAEMHMKFKNTLEKGSHIVHFISPSDHRAYSDPSLSLHDFLKYDQKEWNRIQTKFDYHNRLRLPQYLEIFKSLDYEIIYLTFDSVKKDSEQHCLFKNIEIHSDYKNYSDEELTAGNINIVLKV